MDDTRTFTYRDQPNNLDASRIGEACSDAAKSLPSDHIDLGLALLCELEARGFGVTRIARSERDGEE